MLIAAFFLGFFGAAALCGLAIHVITENQHRDHLAAIAEANANAAKRVEDRGTSRPRGVWL